jgi:hypothetical protein
MIAAISRRTKIEVISGVPFSDLTGTNTAPHEDELSVADGQMTAALLWHGTLLLNSLPRECF